MGTMNDEPEIIIGDRQGWGASARFGVRPADLRHHLYVIGKTGSGKSTLLRNMIIQHIALGHGVGVIDPHGDLAEELLNHISRSRTNHLVYFNPSDAGFPISLNLLANVPKDERHLVASGVVGAFKSLWRESWGPRMEYILYNSVAALLDCQNVSLLGVNRMLTDELYRLWVIRQIKDPFIKAFWKEEYAAYDERFQKEAIPYSVPQGCPQRAVIPSPEPRRPAPSQTTPSPPFPIVWLLQGIQAPGSWRQAHRLRGE